MDGRHAGLLDGALCRRALLDGFLHRLLGLHRLLLLDLQLLLLLLLLEHHLLIVARLALGDLVRGAALFHCFGCLRRDVDGTDRLAVRVEGGAGVLAFVARSDCLDEKGHFA